MSILRYLWAFPGTFVGLPFVLLAWCTGRVRVVTGVIEACGGCLPWCLRRLPLSGPAAAITLGHVVLGVDAHWLETTRTHERVHVAQYECWGPLFIPAYLLASAVLYFRGGDPYFDNPFEKAAYERGRR